MQLPNPFSSFAEYWARIVSHPLVGFPVNGNPLATVFLPACVLCPTLNFPTIKLKNPTDCRVRFLIYGHLKLVHDVSLKNPCGIDGAGAPLI
jgi:hypothetical protein